MARAVSTRATGNAAWSGLVKALDVPRVVVLPSLLEALGECNPNCFGGLVNGSRPFRSMATSCRLTVHRLGKGATPSGRFTGELTFGQRIYRRAFRFRWPLNSATGCMTEKEFDSLYGFHGVAACFLPYDGTEREGAVPGHPRTGRGTGG